MLTRVNSKQMIAGKTYAEIMSMRYWTRCRWYKMILPDEKEKAMKIVEIGKRIKISRTMMGRVLSEEHKAKISGSKMGRTASEETKTKMSIAKVGKNFTDEHRINLSKAHMGKIIAEETKIKISKANMGKSFTEKHKNNLKISWTPERRNKMSVRMTGENSPNWQGGTSYEPYGLEFNNTLREQIRNRDNYICQECDITQEECIFKYGEVLSVHHIDYDKTNNELENLICLCHSCHSKTNYNREAWIKHFRRKEINGED